MGDEVDGGESSSTRLFVRGFLGVLFLGAAVWTWRTPDWPEEIKSFLGL
jgi:hypothetical protein